LDADRAPQLKASVVRFVFWNDMRLLIPLFLFGGICFVATSCSTKFNHSYLISKEYDQSDERTYFRLQRIRVIEESSSPYRTLDFSPYVVRSAKSNEDAAYLLFYGSAKARYKDKAHLEIFAAGEKIELMPEGFGYDVSEESSAVFLYKLSLEEFRRIVSAGTVDMSLGDARFQMKSDQLEALRDLYHRAAS
jgi:hypothetical protein